MKQRFLWSAIAAFALLAAGCSKDNTGGNSPDGLRGEPRVARLTISASGLTRAGLENDENAVTGEFEIDASTDLKVFVFDGSDVFVDDYTLDLTDNLNGTYTSDPFEVPQGNMQFFIFANDATGLVPSPAAEMTIEAFKKLAVAAYPAYPSTALSIATPGKFLMGSLWKGTDALVGTEGTTEDPQEIPANIGRLVSKINMVSGDPLNTELEGVFSDTEYRLGTIARTINTVGVFDGTVLPLDDPATDPAKEGVGVEVYSYVHEVGSVQLPGNNYNDTYFVQYSPAYNAPSVPFYATENTTARSGPNSAQFYGNTTYIQIKTVFTPKEMFAPTDVDLETPIVPTKGANFWSASKNGILTYFNANPAGAEGIDDESVESYPGGVMYYKFPVFDPGEEDGVVRNRVLRNHSYTFDVNIVRQLGTPIETVDPTEPITEQTAVDIIVTVLNWDKVTGSVDL